MKAKKLLILMNFYANKARTILGVIRMNAPARIVRLRADAQARMACEDNLDFMRRLDSKSVKLIITSPPYNIGKAYERRDSLENYVKAQTQVISECVRLLHDRGSICWQVGNHVQNGEVFPLDIILFHIFKDHGLQLRNRIVWHFEHGLHCSKRLSGRHESILWFTKSRDYTFNLDSIRVPSKYPNKKYFKGPKVGQLSCNPLGKNPGDASLVKIAERYSHLNGYEFIKVHKPRLWREIEAVIDSVDAEECRTKVSKEKTMIGAKLYSPRALNKAMDTAFRQRGWEQRRAAYYVTRDAKLIRKTLNLSPEEQKREIEEAGEECTRSFNQTDFVKERIAVEVQFGKYFAVSYDLFVKHLAFFVGDVIDVGVEIVPVKALSASTMGVGGKRARQMSTGVPWHEKELYNLIREGRGVPGVPLVLIGVAPEPK